MLSDLRVVVLGASGIGRFHVREFVRAGAQVVGILGSSQASSQATVECLKDEYQVEALACHRLDQLAQLSFDAISICTPSDCHLEHLRWALGLGKPVLVEKPLFWEPDLSQIETERRLAELAGLGAERLVALNVGNDIFMQTALANATSKAAPRRLKFSFFSQGPHHGRLIGVDLLPHALSLLLRLAPEGQLEGASIQFTDKSFVCGFRWGQIDCEFDLREDPDGPKQFCLELDGRRWTRVQSEDLGVYRVHLQVPGPEPLIEVIDPLRLSVEDFLKCASSGAGFRNGFMRAAQIQRLMACLLDV